MHDGKREGGTTKMARTTRLVSFGLKVCIFFVYFYTNYCFVAYWYIGSRPRWSVERDGWKGDRMVVGGTTLDNDKGVGWGLDKLHRIFIFIFIFFST